MVKHRVGKVFGVAMAGGTCAREVISGRGMAVGAVLVTHQAVVKRNGRPHRHTMASGTIGTKLPCMGIFISMAAHAISGCAFVGTTRMAVAAL